MGSGLWPDPERNTISCVVKILLGGARRLLLDVLLSELLNYSPIATHVLREICVISTCFLKPKRINLEIEIRREISESDAEHL